MRLNTCAARTLIFAIDLPSDATMTPRGYARTGTTPDGKERLKWKAKYPSVGTNGVATCPSHLTLWTICRSSTQPTDETLCDSFAFIMLF